MHQNAAIFANASASPERAFGLFRRGTNGAASTVGSLLADLRAIAQAKMIAEDPARDMQGARVLINDSVGHGFWEFYRLGHDRYMVTGDGVFDSVPRAETLVGEGLIEFHLRLAGGLELSLPGREKPWIVKGPCMLMLYQPRGVDIPERCLPRCRDTGTSFYCRPEYLAEIARQNGIASWPLLDEVMDTEPDEVWYRQLELSPTLLHIANSTLRNRYGRGVRLLYAEAKMLELLCEVLDCELESEASPVMGNSELESRQLDQSRRLLSARLGAPLRIRDVSREIGMSESKLKRTFKAKFGMTVFEYSLECRMRHALEMLRCKRVPVGQVARAVGYRHQTSFTAAFHHFFGFLPSQARRMH